MLYLNDKLYELSDSEKKELRKEFPKFPVTLTYIKELFVKNKDNVKPDVPNSIAIPMTSTVTDKKGNSKTFTFSERPLVKDKVGNMVGYPRHIIFTGIKKFTEGDLELLWYIYNCSPNLRGGKNEEGSKMTYYVFENKVKDALSFVGLQEKIVEVQKFIIGKEAFGEDRLRKIAKALYITGVDDLDLAQVQQILFSYVSAGAQKEVLERIQEFENVSGSEELGELRSCIQKALDTGLIQTKGRKLHWVEDGEFKEEFAVMTVGAKKPEFLFEHFTNNDKDRDLLMESLKG
jgi:hypothetical protein